MMLIRSLLRPLLEAGGNHPNRVTAAVRGPYKISDHRAWGRHLMGGGMTRAGVPIDEDRSLQITSVWRAVNLLSDHAGNLPLKIYEEDENGDPQETRAHPAWALLQRKPNPRMNADTLRGLIMASRLLWGNGYAAIEREGRNGPAKAIYWIHSSRVEPFRNGSGELFYRVQPTNDERGARAIPASEMIHVRGKIPRDENSDEGKSVIEAGAESLGVTAAVEVTSASLFGNGARPGGVIERTQEAPEWDEEQEQEFLKQFNEVHQGPYSSGRVNMLNEGMKWQAVGFPPQDLKLIESGEWRGIMTCQLFGVPAHKIYLTVPTKFKSLPEERQNYMDDGLLPRLGEAEAEFTNKLLTPEEVAEGWQIRHDVRAFLRGDSQSRSQYYKDLSGVGAYSINEVRRYEGLPGIGAAGDLHLVPMNMQPIEWVYEQGPQGGSVAVESGGTTALPAEKADALMQPVFLRSMDKLVGKEIKAVGAAAKKYAGNEAAMLAWVDRFSGPQMEAIEAELEFLTLRLAEASGVLLNVFERQEEIGRIVQQHAAAFAIFAVDRWRDPEAGPHAGDTDPETYQASETAELSSKAAALVITQRTE